ncbi:hypothetical protein ACLB2K_050969 [Fragaria x ananassa]
MALTYHGGALLQGDLPVSILWYGNFSPAQKSIIADFLLSLNHKDPKTAKASVTQWWNSVQTYMKKAGQKPTNVSLSTQLSDHNCSLGKTLKKSQITELARRANFGRGRLTLVLTAPDVAVEGFCMSNCGFHDSNRKSNSVFIWVGNSATQCPGQCAWPFHQPVYGPQTPPLVAPNADVGVDGMVVNIATLLAGTVTNPFANGFYLGSTEEPLEAASACTGVYGKEAYPGYAGELLVDANSGASYNAVGVNGRKYLLPALFDPYTSQCETIV